MRCSNCNAELFQTAEWCTQCLTPVNAPGPGDPGEGSELDPIVTRPPKYSAIRQGPYSFGIVGKLVITAMVVLVGLGLLILGTWMTTYLKTPGLALVWLIMIPYTVLSLLVLWGTWRPTRVK